MMNAKTTKPTNRWLAVYRPNPQADARLFCFPYAGGNVTIFRSWHEALPHEVETCAVQLPGRGARTMEPLFTNVRLLVEELVQELLPFLDKSFVFFGHSMGALISFELTRQLRRAGLPQPLHLFLSGRSAPQILNAEPRTFDLPEDEFIAELRRLDGTPQEVLDSSELLQFMLPILRADFELCQTYQYYEEPPLDCPITAFGGIQDQEVNRVRLEGWRMQTCRDFCLRVFPGGHFFLHTAQPLLLQALSHDLKHLSK